MKFAIEGCAHGELNKIYECITHIEQQQNIKVDLLICCGDFQSVRDKVDLNSMAVPDKYMEMKDFWEYYTGERIAPVLTIFIGGNHEATSYLWELPYGGWVAPNIYYLGFAGVVSFAGIRIGGMSGIFKQRDYLKDHFEVPPFDNSTKRSFYHVRKRDVERLKLLKNEPPHVMLSHDWPDHIYDHGDKEQLLRFKPFLRDDIENEELGNPGAGEVLHCVQPPYWFSGHMHAKFAALVNHTNGLSTKFLALDKCLPKRRFLQVIEMGEAKGEGVLKYDPYWLGILKMTNEVSRYTEVTAEHIPTPQVLERMENSCTTLDVLPFSKSVNGQNPQTTEFCEMFGVKNPCQRTTWKTITETSRPTPEATESVPLDEVPPLPTSTPRRKMVLPSPGTGDTTAPRTANNDTSTSAVSNTSCRDDDEFGELTNPSSLSLDVDDMSSSSSNEDSGSSSSSNSDNDGDSDDGNDTDDDDGDVVCKPTFRDPPSFIETPIAKKTSASTPLKTVIIEDDSGGNLGRKELSFGHTPNKNPDSPLLVKEKTDESNITGKNMIATSDYGSDGSARENTTGGETDQGEKETPVKKFKLVRRNQSIYTPSKED